MPAGSEVMVRPRTLIVTDVTATFPPLSVTVTEAVNVPATVGVPLSPVLPAPTPFGRPVTVNLYPPVPPLALKVAATDPPTDVATGLGVTESVRVGVGGGDGGFTTTTAPSSTETVPPPSLATARSS